MAPNKPPLGKLNTTTRAASRSGTANPGNPGTPAGPGTPVIPSSAPTPPSAPRADPLSKSAAKRLLIGQNYLDKTSDAITLGLLQNILTQFCARAEVSTTTASLLMAVAVLLPDAAEVGYNINKSLKTLAEKVDELAELVILPSESQPTPENSQKLADLDKKIDRLAEVVAKSQESAAAAEDAAIEAQKQLITMAESGWETVTNRRNARSPPPDNGPVPSRQPNAGGPPMRRKPPANNRDPNSDRRLLTEGCYLLVEPASAEVIEAMNGMSARELVQKADQAWETAWKALLNTDFVRTEGREHRPRIVFKTATRLARGGIRYEMGDRVQAAYLSDARVALEFEKGFGDVSCKGQGAQVLLQCAPVTFEPENPLALRHLEMENQLCAGDILSAKWVKPVHRRTPNQKQAVLRLNLRSQELADRLITEGGRLDYTPVVFRKISLEPTRCLKCQNYGHLAKKCKGLGDICSQCGAGHRSKDCDNREAKYCVSCKTDSHCSYDRACPAFREECEQFNQRRPENRSCFFNTSRDAQAPANDAPRRPFQYSAPATLADRMPNNPDRRHAPHDLHAYFTSNRRIGFQEREIRDRALQAEPVGWPDNSLMAIPMREPPPHGLVPAAPAHAPGPLQGLPSPRHPGLPQALGPFNLAYYPPPANLHFPHMQYTPEPEAGAHVARLDDPAVPQPLPNFGLYSPSRPPLEDRVRLRPASPHPARRTSVSSMESDSTAT